MQLNCKVNSQKIIYFLLKVLKHPLRCAHDDEIINISDVIFYFEFMFDKLIEFIQVDIGEELAVEALINLIKISGDWVDPTK